MTRVEGDVTAEVAQETDSVSRFHSRWAIVAGCFLCCFSYGFFYTFGVFFKSIQVEFGWGRGLTSTIQSLHWFFFPVSCLVIGWLTDRYGPKMPLIGGATIVGVGVALLSQVRSPAQFLILYALASLGSGVTWALPTATVQRWFVKQRGLALGIAASGIGVGYVLSLLSSWLISDFGWRIAYLVLGCGIWLVLAVATWLIAVGSQERGGEDASLTNAARTEGWEVNEAVRNFSFWQVSAMYLCHIFAVMIVAVHLVNFATDKGIAEAQAAAVWFVVGLFSIPGRIMGGYMGERIGYRQAYIICGLCNSLLLLWLSGVNSLWMLLLFAPVYGFFYGGQPPTFPGLLGHFFGLKALATLVGLMMFAGVLGASTAPYFAGWVYDQFGSYNIAFLTAAGFWGLGAFLAFLVRRPTK